MRNLRNIRHSTWRCPTAGQERQITATAWDASTDSIVLCRGPSENDALIELVRLKKGARSGEHTLVTSWDAPCPNPNLSCDQILSFHYFGDSLTACLVLAGGDIVVVREDPVEGEDRIEIVGSVDAGISAAKWSPDEELLAITTNADTLVFMSRTFEGIMDITMTSDDLNASNHVSVGWGKKETQFKGRGAKALQDPTMPEKVDEGVLSPDDGQEVTITWRGDGAYVAISTIHASARRLVRVYSREGALDSASEPVDGLEGALSWRPAGNLIAGIQRLSDRVDVVFFERNGLRHGQFSLREPHSDLTGKHISLAWNSDSSVLAVAIDNKVQLWTMGNYHWYLKQEILSGSEMGNVHSPVVWSPEKPLLLMIAGTGSIITAEYIFTINRGSTGPPNDHGAVAVIDGKILKLTPMRSANVPPPMAACEVEIKENIIDIAFSADCSSIAVLHRDGIVLLDSRLSGTSPQITIAGHHSFGQNLGKDTHQQISFHSKGIVATLNHDGTDEAHLNYFKCDAEGGKIIDDLKKEPAFGIYSFEVPGLTQIIKQNEQGELYTPETPNLLSTAVRFPVFLPWMEVAATDDGFIAFGQSQKGHLYANSRLLAKNCTSFILTPAHLIFTTTTHLLKFVHITNVEDLEVPQDDPEKDERCRSIERGARIVTAMPSALSLVLQMPRGNLETIWPRAMVLAGIRRLIDEKNYKRAYLHCRTQRVDMNVLYDYNPQQFLDNVGLFVDQVKKVSYIDLFLSSLREEDVSQTMYRDTSVAPDSTKRLANHNNALATNEVDMLNTKSSKVNRICDAVLEVLKSRTATNLQNIITANVCKSPPALEDGLSVVASLMESDEKLADKAVEHISFLADVNKLYDNALGLYNLELTILVAQQSQKDPREYLPFLQSLSEMDPVRRQFTIDDHLGRHERALTHLHTLSNPNPTELDAYVVKHTLYRPALTLYRYIIPRHNEIMSLYANYLESTSSYPAAALAYESLGLYIPATSCYQRASPSYFRSTLFCALQQDPPLSSEALESLASSLADALYEVKDYISCAEIQSTYLSNIFGAITTLCKGYYFDEALLLAAKNARRDVLAPDGLIDIGLADSFSATTELLSECKAQLQAQVPRIRDLRAAALADPLAFYEGEQGNGGDVDLPDNLSVAASSRISTSASLFTRYTGRQSAGTAATGATRATSKNKRREERKRARGKKGSIYEEEYLVASVGRLVERVESVREEVGRLVLGLVRRGMRERALAAESAVTEVVEMCRAALTEVYGDNSFAGAATSSGKEANGVGDVPDNYRPIGGDAVLAKSLEVATQPKVAPVIAPFEKLSLLGS